MIEFCKRESSSNCSWGSGGVRVEVWGFSCLNATAAIRGGSLLFKTEFPEIFGTDSIRGIRPQQPYHCPASGNVQISINEIFSV